MGSFSVAVTQDGSAISIYGFSITSRGSVVANNVYLEGVALGPAIVSSRGERLFFYGNGQGNVNEGAIIGTLSGTLSYLQRARHQQARPIPCYAGDHRFTFTRK